MDQDSFKIGMAISLLVALFTWLLHMAAVEMANGREADFSGRHSGIKAIVAWLIDLIGPTGVLIAGGLAIVLCLVGLAKRVSNPPTFRIQQRVRPAQAATPRSTG